ncbi:hypothetical protein BDF20DRAFT_913404 [Mycotypha africana]|uniref:uncharacterized protein n=1 Tax=Mycotypha africana TaxID=64632 RepID=UPI0023008186|nr:uncharacterized protein BDF20DRAFT_913404 [Mycotypha africana]KAI8977025.1 hypothetical protein BDF20DRAFT_913404 [Mycotypha africana]
MSKFPLINLDVSCNYQPDGFMSFKGNNVSSPNYGPNSVVFPVQNNLASTTYAAAQIDGLIGHFTYQISEGDFFNAGNQLCLMNEENKKALCRNIAEELLIVRKEILHFERADPNHRRRVEKYEETRQ